MGRRREPETVTAGIFAARVMRIDGVVGIADRRPDHPAVRVEFFACELFFIIDGGKEPADFLFWIVVEKGQQDLALVACNDGAVVSDYVGKHTDDQDTEKYPKAPVTTPIRFEIVPSSLVDWRQFQAAAQPRPKAVLVL